ncbi:epoxyqueuosine reductase QueH [Acidaminobacter sp. JC074]|nr:epoxyqueuosine reductase QueH [Acidaminobacter sp. JC074]MCH4890732.1 epoxyqueuosine reductase QueH [Acidaminobacter sp. JC074]
MMENTIKSFKGEKKTLLIHSCCAPCSSYVLEYLQDYFEITVMFYNPNMIDEEEFEKRYNEQVKINAAMREDIKLVKVPYEPQTFYQAVKGLEDIPEGGERCRACFELRLNEAAIYASDHGMDFFTTTLSISPLKNASTLNELGQKIGDKYGVNYLLSDFKKKNGYKRSVELSKENDLYRQEYCGCIYSKLEREAFMRKQDDN